jgi:nitrite reductase (NADH) small subunit/3-phenylpropionate/trans-cinnamate dioxygenase ferredoxin subunit
MGNEMKAGAIESPPPIPHNRPLMNSDAANNREKLYYRVASIGEVPPGAGRSVEVAGEEIALFNFNGAYYAISDMCPHRGASLAEGFLDGGKVFCPWHCFDFNLKSGECGTLPSLRVRTYEVKIAGEDIFVAC